MAHGGRASSNLVPAAPVRSGLVSAAEPRARPGKLGPKP